ncbi:MAG: hypothetical protein COZ16_00485 [Flavobacteriaceae bacterium CG_4_10_14_3_um_filter_31_253]|nr:MAG: hypothetical protein AUK46_08660 [Flavobacteriaceae bacterium CG2_30_31_66]PIV95938.1 MAG: hypothetical protein COW43_10775 [Flavobacteriaceae bacterium CG17_big_fil_post_rev_8_21_14_2_50_31_13]PIX13523.1 MAG: hypothetical protein COZ74_05820 [Flavobacteriaceae bacterium CG_4_8_14_3_um_filter_31_8]PIY16273.1 MAG: hypothetical protein COZ16_00485 [Flavobacteriaceae bacterium CG_4_10_14_3_um_filter_31_253]PIZ11935.1 MAG: hypothetical protein COY55_02300 [Flavobacteriaceae bacterium CG_4_1
MSDDGLLIKDIGIYFQYISLIMSCLYFKKYEKSTFYKYFIIYFLNIVVINTIITIWFKFDNHWLYDIYTFFEFNIFALIYYHLIKEKKKLRILMIFVFIFNVIYFSSFYFSFINSIVIPLVGVFNSTFIILYFSELLNSDKILNYTKLFPFWMSVGFLLFYLTSVPFFTLLSLNMFDNRLMFPIIYYLTIVFHLVINYGLITCNKINK